MKLDESSYLDLIKLLHLYNIGVLNWAEFTDIVEPYFDDLPDLFTIFKQILGMKITNRRHLVLINKPLTELDLSSK